MFIHANLYSWAWDCAESVTRAGCTALGMSWPRVVHHLQSCRWFQQSCPLLPGLLLTAVRQHSGPWLFITTLRCCICQNVNSEMPVNKLRTLLNGLKIAGFMLDASIPRSNIGFLGFSWLVNSCHLGSATSFYFPFSHSANIIAKLILKVILSNPIDVVLYFAVTGSKILVIMDHVKCFMLVCKGHILAKNLSANLFQILDWQRNVLSAWKFKLQLLWV